MKNITFLKFTIQKTLLQSSINRTNGSHTNAYYIRAFSINKGYFAAGLYIDLILYYRIEVEIIHKKKGQTPKNLPPLTQLNL